MLLPGAGWRLVITECVLFSYRLFRAFCLFFLLPGSCFTFSVLFHRSCAVTKVLGHSWLTTYAAYRFSSAAWWKRILRTFPSQKPWQESITAGGPIKYRQLLSVKCSLSNNCQPTPSSLLSGLHKTERGPSTRSCSKCAGGGTSSSTMSLFWW